MYVNNIRQKQIGMVTMMISVVLLISIGLMSVYTAQVGVLDQRISANHYRAKQAFEAAQAGLDNVITNMDMSVVSTAICTASGTDNNVNSICWGLNNPNTTGGTKTSFIGNKALSDLSVGGQTGHTQAIGGYSISFNQDNNFSNMVRVILDGNAGDGSSNIKITQNLIKTPILGYHPPAPLVAKGLINVDSGVQITNTFADTLASYWSGGAATEGSAVINVTSGGTTGGGYPSQAALAALSNDKFFENFFSESKNNLKKRATVVDCATGCTETKLSTYVNVAGDPVGNNIIWVDARDGAGGFSSINVNNSFNFGTLTNPMILIVDGDFDLNHSNANFFGIIYTTQDFGAGTNNGNITGSLITEKNVVANSVSGPLNLNYSNSVFTNMDADIARFTRVAGSWKDF